MWCSGNSFGCLTSNRTNLSRWKIKWQVRQFRSQTFKTVATAQLVSCPTRLSSSWWWWPQIAPFEKCSIWELLHLRNAQFEKCFIWEMFNLRIASFEKCSIWEMLHLRNVRFEKCFIWEMFDLRNVRFENCSIWEMLHLRNMRMKTNPTFWEGCNFNQEGQFDSI